MTRRIDGWLDRRERELHERYDPDEPYDPTRRPNLVGLAVWLVVVTIVVVAFTVT